MKKQNFKKTLLQMKRCWVLYLFLVPAFVWLLMFHYYPLYGVQIAFQKYAVGDVFGTSEFVGLKYFKQFFSSYWFPIVMKNTILISLLGLVVFPLPIVLALMLNEVGNLKLKKTIQTITYAPHFISTVVVCGMVKLFLKSDSGMLGIAINNIRAFMGREPIEVMMNGPLFKWVYTLSGVWQGVGWSSVIYFAALSAVSTELIDAARVDGANKLQRIWHVCVPAIKPTIVIQLILKCGQILNVGYEKTILLGNDSILNYTEVIGSYVFRSGIDKGTFSYATAAGLFNSVVNCLILLIVNYIVKKLDDEVSLF